VSAGGDGHPPAAARIKRELAGRLAESALAGANNT